MDAGQGVHISPHCKKKTGLRNNPLGEVATVYLVILVISAGIILLGHVYPPAKAHEGLLLAVLFIYSPWLASRFFQFTLPERKGTLLRGARVATLVMAIVFPLFALGNHVYQTRIAKQDFEYRSMSDWPLAWNDRPAEQDIDDPVVWVDSNQVNISNLGKSPLNIQWLEDRNKHKTVLAPRAKMSLGRYQTDGLRIDGAAEQILLGRNLEPAGLPLRQEKNPGWLFWLLAIHLIVVAIPEELFYRGYIQQRLNEVFRGGIEIFGARLGTSIFLSSALFALGHLISIPAPYRLAVFFPSLLFGWLREKTGSIIAPVILHASSNVLLLCLMRHYH